MSTLLDAQEEEWEFEKHARRQKEKEQKRDSLLVHLEKKWEIKLAHGKWYHTGVLASREEALFLFPNNLNLWKIAVGWHFKERLTAEFGIGLQTVREIPPTPNIFAVILGEDISVEGSGGGFLPLELGVKYYLSKRRFRPLVGINQGIVIIRSKYIVAEGNINDGINTTEVDASDRLRLSRIKAGFDYRLGTQAQLNMQASYSTSQKSKTPIGGFRRYEGFMMELGFAFLL